MNALQSYSSDENSEEESYHRETHNKNDGAGNGVDTTTNYDDVGMDISSDCEDSGQEKEGSNHTESTSSRLSGEAGDHSSGEGRSGDSRRDNQRDNVESVRRSSDHEPSRHSRNDEHRSSRGSRTTDQYSSRDQKYKASNRSRRSRSPQSHYSREKRSKSRDRRSRSRERRDRRKRSRSRDRRRDYRRGDSVPSHYVSDSKPGLLPTPHSNSGSQNSPSPLLAAVPALPSYYNPNSVNAAKFAEAERKRKLLWGNKGSVPPSGQDPGPVNTTRSIPPPMGNPALLGLNKSNPQGRQLNLGLGKAQFRINKDSQNKDDSNDKNKTDMTNLWSATTFNNDQDGKMASKFKRLMGVRGDGSSAEMESVLNTRTVSPGTGGGGGSKLTQKQETMFSDMERQYEVARQATHTHRGFGLGFASSSYVQK